MGSGGGKEVFKSRLTLGKALNLSVGLPPHLYSEGSGPDTVPGPVRFREIL